MGTAIVTGASSGLGLELARRLAERGERVVAVARRADALAALAAGTPRIEPFVADLATSEGLGRLLEHVADVDVLVNNAGFGSSGDLVATSPGLARSMVELNVAALTELTAHYLPGMVARGAGRVLNVASTASFQPVPTMAVYGATKAYVLSFTEAVAEELRGSGVTATAFCPGVFASGFQAVAGLEHARLVKGRRLPTSAQMARAALAAMDRGAVIVVPGALNAVGAAATRVAPRAVVRRSVRWMQSDA